MPLVKPAVVQTIELVTPIVAKQFLRSNENNRSIRPTAVNQYSEKMLQGSWRMSTDAIGFDENGVLINGQHRLHAVVKSGVANYFAVMRNMPPETKDALDTGRKRQLHEILKIAGVDITRTATAICTLLYTNWDANCKKRIQYDFHRTRLVKIYKELQDGIDFVTGSRYNGYLAAELTAAVYLYYETDQDTVIDFLHLIKDGCRPAGGSLPGDAAALKYRDLRVASKAVNKKGSGVEWFRLAVTAAHRFAMSKESSRLVQSPHNPFSDVEAIIEAACHKAEEK